jgi:DNA-binding NarL/FixJ family response regulator
VGALGVEIRCSDPVTRDGAEAFLRGRNQIELLPPQLVGKADVVLILATQVGDEVMQWMRQASSSTTNPDMRIVLVADSITDAQLMRAIGFGLVSFLVRSRVGFEQVLRAVLSSRAGAADMPGQLTRTLIEEIRIAQREGGMVGAGAAWDEREVEVIGLLADGLDTGEIAAQLNYSERTIKNIIYAVTHRLGLRNRTHAVAYGIRAGIL